jgi:predicted aconitase with swiveling domain
MEMILQGNGVVAGHARGRLIVSRSAISFWGGVDPASGRIVDPRHELFGRSISRKVVAFPHGKGSSTGSLILFELARLGKSPAGMINIRTEPILATGPIVIKHFYGIEIPILNLDADAFGRLESGRQVDLDAASGRLVVYT